VLSKLQNGNVRGSLAQFTTLPETQATAQASNAGENSTLAPQRPVTSNPDLRNCLDSGLSIEKAQFSNQLAMELLSKGTPFICQGYFRFPNGLQGWHASTVIGYEYAETNHGGLRYRLMDSYWQRPVTIDELNCETVLVINVGA
jgi:hypothetical protein